MCIVTIYHDPDDAEFPLRVWESRDVDVNRLHGHRALLARKGVKGESYGTHWKTEADLKNLPSIHPDPQTVLDAAIVGGYDISNGTWVAVSQKNGIYAKLLIGIFENGVFGENLSQNEAVQREKEGYIKRGGLPLDAVSFSSAREAAEKMPAMLEDMFKQKHCKMLPSYLVVADEKSAHIIHIKGDLSVAVYDVPPKELQFVSIRGVNVDSSIMTKNVRPEMLGAELPDPAVKDGWDTWINQQSIQARFGDEDHANGIAVPYQDPRWRSHRFSLVQPPYLNVDGPRSHMRPDPANPQPGDIIEWTASTTCVAANRKGEFVLLYNERHAGGQGYAVDLAGGHYPTSTADYTAVPLRNHPSVNLQYRWDMLTHQPRPENVPLQAHLQQGKGIGHLADGLNRTLEEISEDWQKLPSNVLRMLYPLTSLVISCPAIEHDVLSTMSEILDGSLPRESIGERVSHIAATGNLNSRAQLLLQRAFSASAEIAESPDSKLKESFREIVADHFTTFAQWVANGVFQAQEDRWVAR